jgi:hypothetical protein
MNHYMIDHSRCLVIWCLIIQNVWSLCCFLVFKYDIFEYSFIDHFMFEHIQMKWLMLIILANQHCKFSILIVCGGPFKMITKRSCVWSCQVWPFSIWSWTTYHHFFMFVVLMSNSMLLTNDWTWLGTWCKFQFYSHFHLLKLVVIVLLIYSSHCLVPTYNLTSPNSYCWFDFLGIMGVCAKVVLSSKYSNNYKSWDCL